MAGYLGFGQGVKGFPVRFLALGEGGDVGAGCGSAVKERLFLLGGYHCVLSVPISARPHVVLRYRRGVLRGVSGQLPLRGRDIDPFQQIECRDLHFFEIVVVRSQRLEVAFLLVEDLGDASPDVDLAFDLQVFEGLFAETLFSEGAGAAGDGAGRGAVGEDPVDAGLAHFVVAFGVYEEAHIGVEVAGGFTDGADVCKGRLVERCLCLYLEGQEDCERCGLTIVVDRLARATAITLCGLRHREIED